MGGWVCACVVLRARQGIFVNFKNVAQTSRAKLPFGIAQIGKAFRNEITPRNFIFRSREFEQMEIECVRSLAPTPSRRGSRDRARARRERRDRRVASTPPVLV